MSPEIAVAHYPEGAGHATRMLAVGKALERGGASVRMAGGGAGAPFVERNGYEEYEPTPVDYIDSYQGGSLRQVVTDSVPKTAARVADYVAWLRETGPDALVTDDMFAAMAALRTEIPLYVLKHDMPGLYENRIERAGALFHTVFQHAAARAFFYPAVWPQDASDPEGITHVPPVALDGEATERGDYDAVVVPSHYSELGRIADVLEGQGMDVLDVGSEEWEPVPSLLPYIRAADVVVCSGYSTVMDAAVAGTPCVIHPATDEQDAVAARITAAGVDGFTVAEEPLDVIEAATSPPEPPSFENGAAAVADAVLDDLEPETAEEPVAESPAEEPGQTGVRRVPTAMADRAFAASVAVGAGTRTGMRYAKQYAAAAARRVVRGARALFARVRDSTNAALGWVADTIRAAGSACRRYAIATAALTAATLAFTGGVAGRAKRGTGRRLAAVGGRLRSAGSACRRAAGAVGSVGSRTLSTLARTVPLLG